MKILNFDIKDNTKWKSYLYFYDARIWLCQKKFYFSL